jgi:hypothetical protein
MRSLTLGASLLLLTSCGDDGPAAYQPPGTVVPLLATAAPELATMVAEADQVEGTLPILHGFVDGEPVSYWTVGLSPATPQRVRVLCREAEGECVLEDHPMVLEALPGEEGYSAFARVTEVHVTEDYAGEVMPSFEAIDDAVRDGLATLEERNAYINCPVVAPDIRLELPGGDDIGGGAVYVRGMEAACLLFDRGSGRLGLGERGTEMGEVLIRNVYVLTREGEEMPLMEAARMEDITGDGDAVDSNNIFGAALGDVDYTPLWRMVAVTVPSDYASIDTASDQTMADYTRDSDMFTVDELTYEIAPIDGQIVGYEETDMLINCPLVP